MKTLIVEDNAEDRKILTYNLETEGRRYPSRVLKVREILNG
jgi:CheY-like chemotaxis protein